MQLCGRWTTATRTSSFPCFISGDSARNDGHTADHYSRVSVQKLFLFCQRKILRITFCRSAQLIRYYAQQFSLFIA